jgi:hypothetical protein
MAMFVNRHDELAALQRWWRSDSRGRCTAWPRTSFGTC